MNASSTNKLQTNIEGRKKSSQSDLHAKILNIVANRMNPTSTSFVQEKQICGSCIQYLPNDKIDKKNSLTTTRNKDGKTNKTVCQSNQKTYFNHQTLHDCILTNKSHIHKRMLQMVSKVITFKIHYGKMGDIPTDFTNYPQNQLFEQTINNLRQQNQVKSRRIINLQRQVSQLHEKIIQLNLNLQIKSKPFSELQLPASESINRISSIHDTHPNQSKETTKVWIEFDGQNICRQSENKYQIDQNDISKYDSLLRMLKIQALSLQNSVIKQRSSIFKKEYQQQF